MALMKKAQEAVAAKTERDILDFADELRYAAELLESSIKSKAAGRRARVALNKIKRGITDIKRKTMEVKK